MSYKVNAEFSADCGFGIGPSDVLHAATITNAVLSDLPASLFKSIDFKTSSAVVGAIFCEHIAERVGAIVNPIEKGHPDVIPASAAGSTEELLRNYPSGLEVKSTIGNITQGTNLRAGVRRVDHVIGITWQAHHRDVTSLMGIVWDFNQQKSSFRYPAITGIFFANDLHQSDWGEISGTTGRNTKVSGMLTSGKSKMGAGWVLVWDEMEYLQVFRKHLSALF